MSEPYVLGCVQPMAQGSQSTAEPQLELYYSPQAFRRTIASIWSISSAAGCHTCIQPGEFARVIAHTAVPRQPNSRAEPRWERFPEGVIGLGLERPNGSKADLYGTLRKYILV